MTSYHPILTTPILSPLSQSYPDPSNKINLIIIYSINNRKLHITAKSIYTSTALLYNHTFYTQMQVNKLMIIDFFRILAIARILAKHNLTWLFCETPCLKAFISILKITPSAPNAKTNRKGQNIANACQELGPIFIKFGQILSVRSDIIGDEIANDLSQLQDALPPFPTNKAIKTIETSLKKPINQLFSQFNEQPTAAASIAQVHKATTPEGQQVAVKILRPNIEKIFRKDLRLLRRIATILEIFVKPARRLKPKQVINTFEKWMTIEIDLTLEAAAATKMKDNFKNRTEKFYIPKVYWQYSSNQILVTEWINGFRIDDINAIKNAKLNPKDIQITASRVFFMQIFYDRFFHADMHPGNIFIQKDGTITPIDFGIMGHIDENALTFLADILIGFFQADYDKIADAHFNYGIIPQHHSRFAFALAMRAIGEPLQGLSMNQISVGKLLAQLFQTTQKFNMQTQPQLLLLQKTIFMSEALGRNLNPNANMWTLAKPLIEDWILLNHSTEAKIYKIIKNITNIIEQLPDILKQCENLNNSNNNNNSNDNNHK